MIPTNITSNDIVAAISRADETGYDVDRSSENYDLKFGDNLYPPKVIVSYANKYQNEIDLPASEFRSGSETTHFLMKRGFPILVKSIKNPENFFTVEDLYFFNQIKDHFYNPASPIDTNKREYIKKYIWQKSKKWADMLALDGSFKISGGTHWNTRKGKAQGFKKYSWYKIHPNTEPNKQIFYTVGIDAVDSALVIKLDCLREGTNVLPKMYQNYFDQLLKKNSVEWRMFFSKDIENLTWEILLNESRAYIESTIEVYQAAVHHIQNKNLKKYARICWNTHSWKSPSGFGGKSITAPHSQNFIHERDNGFAPEEWLLDLEKTIDGHHYSRIEPVHTKTNKHVLEKYDLIFYAFDSSASKWYWIAEIDDVEVISKETSMTAYEIYKSTKWWLEQKQQLVNLQETDDYSKNINVDSFVNWSPEDFFNIRFRPEQVRIYSSPQQFSDGELPPSLHYNLPDVNKTPAFKTPVIPGGIDFKEANVNDDDETPAITKQIIPRIQELQNVHSATQKSFLKFLRARYPEDKIGKECTRIGYSTRVDLVRRSFEHDIFYEIKTYPDVLISLRVAIGQLLEYRYYPDQQLAGELVVVTHLSAEQPVYDYLKHLNNIGGLQIGLICFDHITGKVISSNVGI